jgi:hypothetical protein
MKLTRASRLSSTLIWTAVAVGQSAIPPGTVLPVALTSSLNSRKSAPGKVVTARIMQDVPLAGGSKIKAGARVIGHLVSVRPATNGQAAQMAMQFDRVKFDKADVAIRANLRALASLMEVEDTQVPTTGPDRGTPSTWITRNLVGGEVAYGAGGPVVRGTDSVGIALVDGVLVPVSANVHAGCRDEISDNHQRQALWVFSSDACGIYGYPDVRIAHSGRTEPYGEIQLTSPKDFVIRGGSGMLLRVN